MPNDLRNRIARVLRTVIDQELEEQGWGRCDPPDPTHTTCSAGRAARLFFHNLLSDTVDGEHAPSEALDAIMREILRESAADPEASGDSWEATEAEARNLVTTEIESRFSTGCLANTNNIADVVTLPVALALYQRDIHIRELRASLAQATGFRFTGSHGTVTVTPEHDEWVLDVSWLPPRNGGCEAYPDQATALARAQELANLTYLCQLCFHRYPLDKLNTALDGNKEDVCINCARAEKKHQENR